MNDSFGLLIRISESVGRLEGSVDGIHKEQARIATYTAATSKRIGLVERRQDRMLGWAAGAGAAGGLFILLLKYVWLG